MKTLKHELIKLWRSTRYLWIAQIVTKLTIKSDSEKVHDAVGLLLIAMLKDVDYGGDMTQEMKEFLEP